MSILEFQFLKNPCIIDNAKEDGDSLTPNKENFIKAIYELNGDQEIVTNRQLVEILEVSAASITEMNARLVAEDIIESYPYKGVQLTDKGLAIAKQLIRKHRLWEVFLYEKLGYQWHELHQDADLLEHVSSDLLINRLDNYLNHPEIDPHGAFIPDQAGQVDPSEYVRLNTCRVGDEITIKQVEDDRALLSYLTQKEVQLNKQYLVADIQAFDGAITLKDDQGVKTILSPNAVNHIYISKKDK